MYIALSLYPQENGKGATFQSASARRSVNYCSRRVPCRLTALDKNSHSARVNAAEIRLYVLIHGYDPSQTNHELSFACTDASYAFLLPD